MHVRDAHGFFSRRLTALDPHRCFRHAEPLGDKGDERLIGAPLLGRAGDLYLERIAVQSRDRGIFRARPGVNRKQPAVRIAPEPLPQKTPETMRVSPPTRMSATSARSTTKSGDRSMLPIGGIQRRKPL